MNGLGIPTEVGDAWTRLEMMLKRVATLLITRFELPAVLPFPPSGHGYLKKYKFRHQADWALDTSRHWFGVWQGLLAFCIASARTKVDESANIRADAGRHGSAYPTWLEHLSSKGIEETWLDGLMTSTICNFSDYTPRAGIVIDLLERDPYQPDVDWFVQHCVPVWYRWSEVERADAALAQWAPPEQELNQFSGQHGAALPHLPASSQFHPPKSSEWKETLLEHSKCRERLMREIIRDREEKMYMRMATADQRDCQRWLDRQRNPPKTKCKVYIWSADPHDESQLQHEKADNADVLWEYTDKQKWYDPVYQIWHCCLDLARDEAVDEDDADLVNEYYGPDTVHVPDLAQRSSPPPPPECPALVQSSPTSPQGSRESSLSPPPLPSSPPSWPTVTSPPRPTPLTPPPPLAPKHSASTNASWDLLSPENFLPPTQYDEHNLGDAMLTSLAFFYGFVAPLPQPLEPPTIAIPDEHRSWLLRILGFHPSISLNAPFFNTELCRIALKFMQEYAGNKGSPRGEDWDLHRDNRDPLLRSKLLYKFCVVPSGSLSLFVFDLPHNKHHWKVAVTNCADATLICRMDVLTAEDMVIQLVTRGVRFHTLLSANRPVLRRPSQRPPPKEIPIRWPNYRFTIKDYEAYIHSRNLLLADGRMRAALLRGGIVWRIAITYLSPWDALDGPSGAPGLSIVHPRTGEQLVDDDLTPVELQLLCGAYKCYTGPGEDQVSIKSWWPLPESFEREDCGENYGRWTSYRENHFTARLLEIISGKGGPLSIREWRDRMRGRSELRRLKINIEKESRVFLQGKCVASGL